MQLGPCREGGPSPRPTRRTAPHPGAGRTLNRAQTLTGPDPEGEGKGPALACSPSSCSGRGGVHVRRAEPPRPRQAPEGCGVPGELDRGM